MSVPLRTEVWQRASDRCEYCPNPAGYDPETDTLGPLFHPRTQNWSDHFRWNGGTLEGLTAVGRTTISALRINATQRIQHRVLLIRLGDFPSRASSG